MRNPQLGHDLLRARRSGNVCSPVDYLAGELLLAKKVPPRLGVYIQELGVSKSSRLWIFLNDNFFFLKFQNLIN